jgi:hypothetical protein
VKADQPCTSARQKSKTIKARSERTAMAGWLAATFLKLSKF